MGLKFLSSDVWTGELEHKWAAGDDRPRTGIGINWKAAVEAFGSSGTASGGVPVLSLAFCIASVRWQQLWSLGQWCSGHALCLSYACSLTVFRKKITYFLVFTGLQIEGFCPRMDHSPGLTHRFRGFRRWDLGFFDEIWDLKLIGEQVKTLGILGWDECVLHMEQTWIF